MFNNRPANLQWRQVDKNRYNKLLKHTIYYMVPVIIDIGSRCRPTAQVDKSAIVPDAQCGNPHD